MNQRRKSHKKEPTAEESEAIDRRRKMAWVGIGLLFVIGAGLIVVPYLPDSDNTADAAVSKFQLKDIPFNGERAYKYLKQLADIGPRCSGSEGMTKQQKLIIDHFEKLGAKVEKQEFTAPDPRNGKQVPMTNIIVHWNPKSKKRILLCSHYDTLPYPMLDHKNPKGRFVGANDGASSTALLMELGNEMKNVQCQYGVDFVFFDGEEYIFRQWDSLFRGSEYFAKQYKNNPPGYQYVYAVLLDMIGDANLQIFYERHSMKWRDSRRLVHQIWDTARRLGVKEFIPRTKHLVYDDHLALHDIAGIPSCDVIDFDYPVWHTQGDTADKCSALSLAKVGWVIREWLKTAQ
ncbi:MAG: M28 family peptidase [Planctomycetia bacterium]|jgi:hypothetical protein